jgi:hypothetical protein
VEKPGSTLMEKAAGYLYVFGALGMVLLMAVVLGVRGYRDGQVSADLSRRGVAIEAVVADVQDESESIEPSGGLVTWTDVTVTFTDSRGGRVRATAEGGGSERVGERLRVVYDPVDPAHVRWSGSVDEGTADWVFAGVALVVFAGLLAAFVGAGFRGKKAQGKAGRPGSAASSGREIPPDVGILVALALGTGFFWGAGMAREAAWGLAVVLSWGLLGVAARRLVAWWLARGRVRSR